MAVFPILLYLAIGILLHRNLGHYNNSILPLTVGFLMVTGLLLRWGNRVTLSGRKWEIALAAILPIFLVRIMKRRLILNAEAHWSSGAFDSLILASIVLSLALIILYCLPRAKEVWIKLTAATLGTLLLAAQILVPILSPRTKIDVFLSNTAAARYFLSGLNPYPQQYENIYRDMYDYLPGMLYFPGTFIYQAPFLALFGDVRYGFVFANLVIASGLYWLARRRAAPRLACLFPLLWLSFPVTYFVLEQAWTDTVLVMLTVVSFVLIEKRRFHWAGVALGFAFAFKQYAFVLAGVGVMQIWAVSSFRKALESAGIAAITFAVVLLPFALSDWESLYRFTIANQINPGLRKDAYNFTVYLFNKWNTTYPKGLGTLISVGGILSGLYLGWRGKAALGLFVAYGMAFFFGKWAFCNYYYLLVSFLLLYLLSRTERPRNRIEAP